MQFPIHTARRAYSMYCTYINYNLIVCAIGIGIIGQWNAMECNGMQCNAIHSMHPCAVLCIDILPDLKHYSIISIKTRRDGRRLSNVVHILSV